MKRIYEVIRNDINKYSYSRFTVILMDLLMYKYKLNAYCLKISISNGVVIPIKRLNEKIAGSAFMRRGESMIKLLTKMTKHHVCPDCQFYISINDVYLFYDVPIFIYAKPPSKKGILIPDHTFIDVEPENMAIPRYISINDVREKMDERLALMPHVSSKKESPKINELFFIGQDIALITNKSNLRKFLSIQPKPFNVILDKYMPMAGFTDYKYLLNISGALSWSFRFKFLFLTKSLVINVACFWVQIFDYLFIPGVDYINIQANSSHQLIKDEIITAVCNENISAIAKSGYKKGKLLTLKSACTVLFYTIKHWCKKFNNGISTFDNPGIGAVYLKKIKLAINNMDAYNEIKLYDTLEKAGHGDLLIPLINYYIEDDFLYCYYALAEPVERNNRNYNKRLTKIFKVFKTLGITIHESSANNIKNVLWYAGKYYISNFKRYTCVEDIKAQDT